MLVAASPSVFSPNDPYAANVFRRLEPPSLEYFFGTDEFGRCVFSRVIFGAGISLATGFSVLLLSLLCGGLLGAIAGYLGGWTDEVIMRVTDIFMAIPSIVVALVLARSFGPGTGKVVIILSITMWPGYARMIRGLILEIKNEHYVKTAMIIGFKNSYILGRHILPGILPPILVMAALGMGRNILMISSLSFLGLGIVEPTPDWGAMLSKGITYIRIAPHLALFPGLFICLTVLVFNLTGDALNSNAHRKLFITGLGGLK